MADDRLEPSNAGQPPPHIHRPVPRRAFDPAHIDSADSPTHAYSQATPPASANETRRSSDFLSQLNARLLRTYNARDEDGDEPEGDQRLPPRNKSFLNMTSSTLFGIYDEVDSAAASMAETPWGTGAETPAHTGMGHHAWDSGMGSPDAGMGMKIQARKGTQTGRGEGKRKAQSPRRPRHGVARHAILGGKLAALFMFGVIYGLIVSHLHDTRQLSAVHLEGMDRENWIYLTSWGFFGVALGSLLPYVDLAWSGHTTEGQVDEKELEKDGQSPVSEQINDVVRSVAAFVGIAFAIVSNWAVSRLIKHTNSSQAPAPVAIYLAAHVDTCPRQSCALVYTRPLKTRPFVLTYRHLDPHVVHLSVQSRCSSLAIATSNDQRNAATCK
jgi:hypothetical protein